MTRPTTAREEAEQSPLDIAMDALYEVRRAIFNADPKVLTCTLWMPTDTYSGGTVVDFIENEMERVRALRPSAEAGGVEAVALGPIPVIETFAINPVGEGDITVEGSNRFAHERDVAKVVEWARAAEKRLAALSPPATPEPALAGKDDWQDISTAPKDESVTFIACEGPFTYQCGWQVEDDGEGHRREGWYDFENRSFENPTLWQPFPKARILAAIDTGQKDGGNGK